FTRIRVPSMTSDFEPTSPFFAANATFVEELYERYLQNPNSVDESWRELFKQATNGAAKPSQREASWTQITSKVIGVKEELPADKQDKKAAASSPEEGDSIRDSIGAIMLVRAYRVRGHLMANLDPLGIEVNGQHPELDP